MTPCKAAIMLAAAISIQLLASGCEKQTATAPPPPPPPQVTVSKPVTKAVSEKDEYVGRFVAVDYVEIRARVSGYLQEIKFKDGQIVQKGDPLFTIDKRPFEAARDQAQAALVQSQANTAYADSEMKRGQELVRGTTITQQTFEQRVQNKRVADSNVIAREAAIKSANLDLEFSELTAPVSGRIGDRRVAVGNLVTGGAGGGTTLLATIASTDPIRFEFTMDEASYLRYARLAPNSQSSEKGLDLPVRLKLLDEQAFAHEGKLDFIDNVIDKSSGAIRGRAVFGNPQGTFTPGMFARIEIAAKEPENALLVPESAIGTEQVRKFVMTVDDKNVANPKFVTLGGLVDGLRVIKEGLKADDVIIVNGLMRARPGSKVAPQQAETPPDSVSSND